MPKLNCFIYNIFFSVISPVDIFILTHVNVMKRFNEFGFVSQF